MTKTEPVFEYVIFEKCPVCKSGKVQELKPTGMLSFAKSSKIICNRCNARFKEGQAYQNERVFRLDLSNSDQKNKYDGDSLKLSEWKRGISDLDFCIQTNTLPQAQVVGLKIILNRDEQAHCYSGARLMEERAVRQSTGGAIRVTKGLYVGRSKSESHGELRIIDSGSLLLTNKRLIFNGDMRNIEYRLDKIISVEEYKDAIEIGSSNRQKVQLFVVAEPHKWAVYITLAVQNSQGEIKGRSKHSSSQGTEKVSEFAKGVTEFSLFDEAKQMMRDHRYKEAEKKFNEALSIKKHGFIYCGMGDLLYKLEKYDEAIKSYKAALKLEPDIPYPKRAIEKIERKLKK